MNPFWYIPLAALSVGIIMTVVVFEHKINTVFPNAEIELYSLKEMSCSEIKARNSIGSYWIPSNGVFARDKVDACKVSDIALKKHLNGILKEGTHQEKIDAGFTKLWFGVYDHQKLPFLKVFGNVTIPFGTIVNNSLYPSEITVIVGYNSTIQFKNEDHVGYLIEGDEFGTPMIMPNATGTIRIDEPGEYNFHSHISLSGTITALEQ